MRKCNAAKKATRHVLKAKKAKMKKNKKKTKKAKKQRNEYDYAKLLLMKNASKESLLGIFIFN